MSSRSQVRLGPQYYLWQYQYLKKGGEGKGICYGTIPKVFHLTEISKFFTSGKVFFEVCVEIVQYSVAILLISQYIVVPHLFSVLVKLLFANVSLWTLFSRPP